MSSYRDIQAECCEANISLPGFGLVDLTFGNVSVADPQAGVFAIKPSGVDYNELTPDQMIVVDYEGNIVEGALRPSSDTPTHRRLFMAFMFWLPLTRPLNHAYPCAPGFSVRQQRLDFRNGVDDFPGPFGGLSDVRKPLAYRRHRLPIDLQFLRFFLRNPFLAPPLPAFLDHSLDNP